mgnify:CR=1 FL=1
MSGPAIIVLSPSAMPMAERVCVISGGAIHGLESRVPDATTTFTNTTDHVQKLFKQGETIIGIMAAGALVRLLAPVLVDKTIEPPVIAVSDDGASIVPLLGGHHGANQIARHLAEQLGGHAAVTTAGDVNFGIALDEPPEGWTLLNPDNAKPVMARLLAGEAIQLDDDKFPAHWLRESGLSFAAGAELRLRTTISATETDVSELVYCPRQVVLGIGCERNASADEVIGLAEQALSSANILPSALACIVSLDLKADEIAIHAAAAHFKVPARFFDAGRLEQEMARLKNPSDVVFAEVGCHGVAEGAALAAVGPTGELILEKQKSKRATAALAQASEPLVEPMSGRARGHLSVVGIGPGSDDWRSPEVTKLVGMASDLVGYSLYLDLLGSLTEGKTRHDYDLGKEEDRVRHAMELLAKACGQAARGAYQLGVVYLDLDHFKRINDQYGHRVGDLVLERFAEVSRRHLSGQDFAARLGGEEFMLVLPVSDPEEASNLAEGILLGMRSQRFKEAPGLSVTVSAGLAMYHSEETPDQVILRADRALYQAKESGRDKLVVEQGA